MKKIIFLLFACFACMQGVSAQDFYESSSDIYGLGKTNYQKKWTKSVSFSIAKQAEIGITFRRNFSNYFAWDVYGFSYAYDYYGKRDGEKKDITHEIEFIRTGFRGFTPKIGKCKFYGAVGFGAEMVLSESVPAMCIDLQLGMYIGKRFSIGYQANFHRLDKKYVNHTDHMFRMALDF